MANPFTDDPYFISVYSAMEDRKTLGGILFHKLRQAIQKICKRDPQDKTQEQDVKVLQMHLALPVGCRFDFSS